MGIDYLSPATYQTPNSFKASGPLGGFLAGMNQDIANQITQRGFANDDVEMQLKKQRLLEEQGLLPSKLAAADLLTAKSKDEQSRVNDGTEDAVARALAKSKISDSDTRQVENDVKQKTAAAPLWVQMSQELESMGGHLDPMNPEHQQWMQSWREKMKPYAPNMPAFLDQGDIQKVMMQGQQADNFIKTKSQGALMTPSHINEMQKAAVAPNITASASRYTADKNATSREEVANIRATAATEIQKHKDAKDQLSKQIKEMNTKILERAHASGNIDSLAIGAAETEAAREVNARMKDDPSLKLTMLGADGDAVRTKLISDVAEQLLPGYKQAKTGAKVSDLKKTVMGDSGVTQWSGQGEAGKVYMTPKGPGRFKEMRDGKPVFEKVQ
jgi:hypothetical protein